MPKYYLTVRSTRLIEEVFSIEAPTREEAIDAYYDGEGEMIDDSIVDNIDGSIVLQVEEVG